jgi:aspartyl-tRNA(Asn)/glutamyl-tRNA(Gln) amidotransferase subunit A
MVESSVMKSDDELCFLPVSTLVEQVATRKISRAELVDAYLTRIEGLNGKANAFIDVYATEARLAAQAADLAAASGTSLGPFHGIPVAIKDLVEIEGRITTGGSAQWRERRSTVTASLARRMVQTGLVFLGKTQTVELAYSGWGINPALGTPWNPWDPDAHRIPGGSSSGSAVAVATGLAPWAVGTDTGGSVRLPAAFCGLTGLKTSLGQIPVDGILPLSKTFDTVGPIARSVLDVACLYGLMQENSRNSEWTNLGPKEARNKIEGGVKGLKLARMPEVEREGVDEVILDAYDQSIETLRMLGAEIMDIALPFCFTDCAEPHRTIVNAEAYVNYQGLVEDEESLIDPFIRRGVMAGRAVLASSYLMAFNRIKELRSAMSCAMDGIDALLTPMTEMAALPLEGLDKNRPPSRLARFVNALGMSAVALPNGFTSAGLPTSLQIVCRDRQEVMALRVGYAYQQATNWHLRRPDQSG